MKKALSFIFLSCFSFLLYAQEAEKQQASPVPPPKTVQPNDSKALMSPDEKKAAETLMLKEEVFDFGKIPQGKPVTHIFDASNSGKTELKIANVQASCGCTTPEWEHDKPIPAGGSTKITVGYNAAAEGPFTKLVTITYNENLSKQITIKGEVWKTPASSAPSNAGLNDLKN